MMRTTTIKKQVPSYIGLGNNEHLPAYERNGDSYSTFISGNGAIIRVIYTRSRKNTPEKKREKSRDQKETVIVIPPPSVLVHSSVYIV